MKEFLLHIWNMPAADFGEYCLWGVFILYIIYEAFSEIRMNRIKRLHK